MIFSYILHEKFHARAHSRQSKFLYIFSCSLQSLEIPSTVEWRGKKCSRSYHFLYACTICESLRFSLLNNNCRRTDDDDDEEAEEAEDREEYGDLPELIDFYSSTPPRTRIKIKNRTRKEYKM